MTVVKRTCVNTPLSVNGIAVTNAAPTFPVLHAVPKYVHIFPLKLLITNEPEMVSVFATNPKQVKPVVSAAAPVAAEAEEINPKLLEYPEVTNPPDVPSWNCVRDVPFVLTPLIINVMRFTQAGIPVNVMLVPLVEATEVPCTIFCVDDQFVPSVENIVFPAVVGDNDAPVPPLAVGRIVVPWRLVEPVHVAICPLVGVPVIVTPPVNVPMLMARTSTMSPAAAADASTTVVPVVAV